MGPAAQAGGAFHAYHMISSRASIRQTMRRQRRELPPEQRRRAATLLARHLASSPLVLRSRRIGCYMANDGEMELQPLMRRLRQMEKECYLPVIDPLGRNRLWFAHYREGDRMRNNRYGIPEPAGRLRQVIHTWALDLLLLPLVAFDNTGNRLGMGGGYYDRTLAHLRLRRFWHSPRLLGVAFGFQRLARLDAAPWDIPLDMVATESGLTIFRE